jgi:hypothetical protein
VCGTTVPLDRRGRVTGFAIAAGINPLSSGRPHEIFDGGLLAQQR